MRIGVDVAQGRDIAVFSCGERWASYKFIQAGVTEVTLMIGNREEVGHINQFEKAEGICRSFVEDGVISSSWYSVNGVCHCAVCLKKAGE